MADVNASLAQIPSASSKVYKDECMYCFRNEFSDGGLHVNLKSFEAVCTHHVDIDLQRCANSALYLHKQSQKVPLAKTEDKEEAPTLLAVGVEGGFQPDKKKYDVETEWSILVKPEDTKYILPCPDLPDHVLTAIAAIQAHQGSTQEAEGAAWQEERRVSKYAADLVQLPCDTPVPMDSSEWKCAETGVQENLWLNLTTGFIGSGRQQWDGSGGNGAAIRHYDTMRQQGTHCPLAVKLGTVTAASADVYSYAADEDDLVIDPFLKEHLAHWGLDMDKLNKTEKTMAELQIEKNMEYEFDKITEAGSVLQQVSGPGCIGLTNLGNSCYMNSVLQVLWAIPELKNRFLEHSQQIFNTAPSDVGNDFITQFTKVGMALVNGITAGKHSSTGTAYDAMTVSTEGGLEAVAEAKELDDESTAVKPQMFKAVIGKNHPEFASFRQQDAEEFFSYLLESITREERSAGNRLPEGESLRKLFAFQTVTRTQCSESNKVSYKPEAATALGLQIPIESAINQAELQDYNEREQKRQRMVDAGDAVTDTTPEKVIPKVPFEACLAKYVHERTVDGYHSAALGRQTQALQRVGLGSCPPYLIVQMRRYYYDNTYTPKKLEVLVDVPEHLSLEQFRLSGPQPGEELQPEDDQPAGGQAADQNIVNQLIGMGFSENGSQRAAIATGNSSAEAAMEWVFSHMEDPDFNDPVSSAQPSIQASPESVEMLCGMGFTSRQATAALEACQGNVERAADWLFSRTDDLDTAVDAVMKEAENAAPSAPATFTDGPGDYELMGFISHIGSNTASGHYVCHMKKDGKWLIYNDEKVAVSDKPPRDMGYIYVYKRK